MNKQLRALTELNGKEMFYIHGSDGAAIEPVRPRGNPERPLAIMTIFIGICALLLTFKVIVLIRQSSPLPAIFIAEKYFLRQDSEALKNTYRESTAFDQRKTPAKTIQDHLKSNLSFASYKQYR